MVQEFEQTDLSYKDRLPSMVSSANIEVIPIKDDLQIIDRLVKRGTRISVTSSPAQGIDATLNYSKELDNRCFRVIPHLAARSIRDRADLRKISQFLDEKDIREVFVIGGDNEKPLGDYSYSSKMLDDLLSINRSIKSVGVGGYPEGHPMISDEDLIKHLKDKIGIAKKHNVSIHIKTQACYDPKKIAGWIKNLQSLDIHLPILLGVPTPTDAIKLAKISKKIGVGASVSFLRLTGMGSVLKSMVYDPKWLLNSLGDYPESEKIFGLHVFTFNNIDGTVKWQKNFKRHAS